MANSTATSQNRSPNSSENEVSDIRKRKRMQSNRESAKRSRQRKQKQLDDLTAEVNRLKNQNGQILSTINVTTQLCVNIEADNLVLTAQMDELTNRLNSLNEIVRFLSPSPARTNNAGVTSDSDFEFGDCFPMNSFSGGWEFQSGISPASDAFMC